MKAFSDEVDAFILVPIHSVQCNSEDGQLVSSTMAVEITRSDY